MSLRHFDLKALKAAPLIREPFQYLVVPGFVPPPALAEINRDYPKIATSGSFSALKSGLLSTNVPSRSSILANHIPSPVGASTVSNG